MVVLACLVNRPLIDIKRQADTLVLSEHLTCHKLECLTFNLKLSRASLTVQVKTSRPQARFSSLLNLFYATLKALHRLKPGLIAHWESS